MVKEINPTIREVLDEASSTDDHLGDDDLSGRRFCLGGRSQ
jgi:hypothetical protein